MAELLNEQAGEYARHLFHGPGYVWGEFRCPPEAPAWHEPNAIGDRPLVAFGTTPVEIRAGRQRLVGTANESLWYPAGISYRRVRVGGRGDHSTFLSLRPDLAARLGAPRPGTLRQRGSSARTVLFRHVIHTEIAAPGPDLLAVDDLALRTVTALAAGPDLEATSSVGTRKAVDTIRIAFADDPSRDWDLAELADLVHYSPWFLCRAFHRLTGYPISAYRQQLRLRASLETALRPGARLSEVAVQYGFCSHSHYSRAFRIAFGCTPSQARSRPSRLRAWLG